MEIALPEQITPEQWNHVTDTLLLLWVFVGCMILGAGSMLVAHILVPSLIDSRHISPNLGKGRPVVYAIAALAFAGAIFVFVTFVGHVMEFQDIYPDVWV